MKVRWWKRQARIDELEREIAGLRRSLVTVLEAKVIEARTSEFMQPNMLYLFTAPGTDWRKLG